MAEDQRTPTTDSKHWLFAAALLLSVGLLDLLFEGVSILYLLPALFIARFVRGRAEWLTYCGLLFLVFFSPWLAGSNRLSERGVINRAMGVAMGICMAYVIRERQRSQQLAISERQLKERLRSQDELRSSREQFERLFNASPLPEIIYNLADGRILNVNQQFQEVFECQRTDVIGRTGTELGFWCDLSQRDAMVKAIRDRRTVRDIDARLRSRSGREFDMLISAQVIELGDLQTVILQAIDVTLRKQAERQLLRSASLLQAVAEGTNDAVFVKDRQGKYLLFNEAAGRFVGKPVSEVLGADDTSLFDPASAMWLLENDRRVMDSGQVETREEILTSSGMTRTYLSTKAPYRNEQGEVIGLIGISRDISERTKLEQALRESEQRHRKLFETCADAIFLMDQSGWIRSTNPAAAEMHGYSIQELLSMNIRHLDAESDAKLVDERMARLRAGETLRFEVTHRRKDGSEFPLDVSASMLRIGDELLVLAFDRDKTQQKLLEEQLRQSQKMDAIGQLAGGIAHDFNNLLTVINGYSDLLVEQLCEDSRARPLVLQIAEAGRRAAQLTHQLLAFSRRAYVEPRVLDLNVVVARSEQLLRRLIGEHISLNVKLAADTARIFADEGQIDQVLMNLIVNARDAMPDGGRIVVVTSTATERDILKLSQQKAAAGSYVQLSISDTGVGMTQEICGRIFEPFFTTKATGKGTGLGLSVVHGIIRQSGGYIHVLSEHSVGTTFLLWLPQVSKPADSSDAQALYSPPVVTGKILLVEDDAGVRHLIRDSLLAHGHTVQEAADATDAVQILNDPDFDHDLLVTDVLMPGMTGLQLAATAVERHPALRVLFISGYADQPPTDTRLARPPEFSTREAFLQKPFSPSQLIELVHRILLKDATCSESGPRFALPADGTADHGVQ